MWNTQVVTPTFYCPTFLNIHGHLEEEHKNVNNRYPFKMVKGKAVPLQAWTGG